MAKKEDTTKDLINIDGELVDPDVQDTIQAIMSTNNPKKKDEKWIRFHLLRMFGIDTQTSAKLAGFSPKYGYKLVEKYRNNDKVRHTLETFVSRIPDDYRTACRLMLPDITEAEIGAVRKYKEDPELLIRHPQLAKSIKQAAGVNLDDTPTPKVQTINIKELRLIHACLDPYKPKTEAIEATIISDSGDDDK